MTSIGDEVDAEPRADLDRRLEQRRRHPAALDRVEREARIRGAERALRVAVAVAVEDEVEAGARPELDQVEREPRRGGDGEERGDERDAALRLVRLHALLADEPRGARLVGRERRGEVVPPPVSATARHR